MVTPSPLVSPWRAKPTTAALEKEITGSVFNSTTLNTDSMKNDFSNIKKLFVLQLYKMRIYCFLFNFVF